MDATHKNSSDLAGRDFFKNGYEWFTSYVHNFDIKQTTEAVIFLGDQCKKIGLEMKR